MSEVETVVFGTALAAARYAMGLALACEADPDAGVAVSEVYARADGTWACDVWVEEVWR